MRNCYIDDADSSEPECPEIGTEGLIMSMLTIANQKDIGPMLETVDVCNGAFAEHGVPLRASRSTDKSNWPIVFDFVGECKDE